MTWAMVKVLPEPVTPRRTWFCRRNALNQFGDGRGLVAAGRVIADDAQRRAAFDLGRTGRAVGDKGAVGNRLVKAPADDQFSHGSFMGVRDAFCKGARCAVADFKSNFLFVHMRVFFARIRSKALGKGDSLLQLDHQGPALGVFAGMI
jgi:hypothetical protein